MAHYRECLQSDLLNKLQIQGDAYAVDKDYALIEQLLIGDFRVDELPEGIARADELDSLGSFLRCRRKFVQDREIKELKLDIGGNPTGNVFQQRGEEEIETLRCPLVNRTLRRPK